MTPASVARNAEITNNSGYLTHTLKAFLGFFHRTKTVIPDIPVEDGISVLTTLSGPSIKEIGDLQLSFSGDVSRQLSAIDRISDNNDYNTYRSRNFQTSKAQLDSQAQGTTLLASIATSQRSCPKHGRRLRGTGELGDGPTKV